MLVGVLCLAGWGGQPGGRAARRVRRSEHARLRSAKKPVYLAGFGKNRKATKIHDPIMARAAVLEHGGKKKSRLVSVDLVGLFNEVPRRVRKQLPGFSYILISSTHNHEGPDTLGLWGPNVFVYRLASIPIISPWSRRAYFRRSSKRTTEQEGR